MDNFKTLNTIVNKALDTNSISQALEGTYSVRHIEMPIDDSTYEVPIKNLALNPKIINVLGRSNFNTIGDFINHCSADRENIKHISGLGEVGAKRIFESIADYCFLLLSVEDRLGFILNFMDKNQKYLVA